MEQTGCARTSHEGEASHRNPARVAPDVLLFSRQALARAMPPHGGTPGSQNHRQGRNLATGDSPRGHSNFSSISFYIRNRKFSIVPVLVL